MDLTHDLLHILNALLLQELRLMSLLGTVHFSSWIHITLEVGC